MGHYGYNVRCFILAFHHHLIAIASFLRNRAILAIQYNILILR